ncbi:MAG: carboxypeptidase-like regulatory domain-containing protein [Prevotellaceae bacterium]|jgi:hypothetical protein|nr:carboxypeptidase-like regulatory domain-containing protein [Prevotellaceae bacterium]
MKRVILLLFYTLLVYYNLHAQSLSGTVYDTHTKKPIPEVNIYLDGTSIHTVTDANGNFNLAVGKLINTQLIISHIAYEIQIIASPFEKMPEKIYLKEQTNILVEAVIELLFTRKQMLKAFREQFLGQTRAGKSCKILNEGDIQLTYDRDARSLTAYCREPIIIENEYLSYKIYFGLISFQTTYLDNSINSKNARQSAFYGTSSFVDLKPGDKKTKKRRDDIFKASAVNFFKNLSNNSLKDADYKIFNNGYPINQNFYFIIKDTLSQKLIQIDPESNINKIAVGYNGKKVTGKITVLYNKKQQSEITFLTNKFHVDRYGNINEIDQIFYSGYMGQQRIGHMLPLDYELPDK